MPNPHTEHAAPAEPGVEHFAAQAVTRAPAGKPRGMSYVDSLTPELSAKQVSQASAGVTVS